MDKDYHEQIDGSISWSAMTASSTPATAKQSSMDLRVQRLTRPPMISGNPV